MSRIKAWKQLSHVKNLQAKGDQSFISQSRSTSSYGFNKFRFSKSKIDDDEGSTKNLGLTSINKAKQRGRQYSILNDSKRRSRQNSLVQILDREPIQLTLKKPSNRKFELNAKNLMRKIKKIYDQLKQLAQSLLVNFQKIKEQMELNLLKVTDQLLKINKDSKHVINVHQIFQNGFLSIRKNIIILPQSLTQINQAIQQQIAIKKTKTDRDPMTPLINPSQRPSSKSKPVISSIFSPATAQNIGKLNFKQQSLQKVRPQTERRERVVSFQKSPDQKSQGKSCSNTLEHQSTNSIHSIISQMRGILNE